MKRYIFAGFIILLSACTTIKTTDLQPGNTGCIQLPALEPVVDLYSLESMYPGRTIMGSTTDTGTDQTMVSISKDRRVQDAITLFEREVKDCLTNPYGDRKGYIVCKFASADIRNNIFYPGASVLLLHIPNILGMPRAKMTTTIDVDVEIYNYNDRLLGRYTASGTDISYSAFYYGYRLSSLGRISGINAFKMALNDIKLKIEKDKERLVSELNSLR
jgi:hypothetical protein